MTQQASVTNLKKNKTTTRRKSSTKKAPSKAKGKTKAEASSVVVTPEKMREATGIFYTESDEGIREWKEESPENAEAATALARIHREIERSDDPRVTQVFKSILEWPFKNKYSAPVAWGLLGAMGIQVASDTYQSGRGLVSKAAKKMKKK